MILSEFGFVKINTGNYISGHCTLIVNFCFFCNTGGMRNFHLVLWPSGPGDGSPPVGFRGEAEAVCRRCL